MRPLRSQVVARAGVEGEDDGFARVDDTVVDQRHRDGCGGGVGVGGHTPGQVRIVGTWGGCAGNAVQKCDGVGELWREVDGHVVRTRSLPGVARR